MLILDICGLGIAAGNGDFREIAEFILKGLPIDINDIINKEL